MSISAGTYTVGGVGTDYPGATGLMDAVADMVALTGNLTFDLRGDVTGVNIAYTANNYILTITSTINYHSGRVGVAPKISLPASKSIRSTGSSFTPVNKIVISNIEIVGNGYSLLIGARNHISVKECRTWEIYNCIFNNCIYDMTIAYQSACKIYDNKFFGTSTKVTIDASQDSGWVGDYLFENNTFYGGVAFTLDCDSAGSDFNTLTLKNNVMLGGTSGLVYGGSGTVDTRPYAYNNAFPAAVPTFRSGSSGNLASVVAADEFRSIDSSSSEFLIPNRTGRIYNAGIAPTYVTTDIAGKSIPYLSDYPIGCHVGLIIIASGCGVGMEFAVEV
jgi:hypothetical protein